MFELEEALLDRAVLFDQLARMSGRRFQFLVELADLDRELAHHAHQVVEQLGGHARGRLGFGARGGSRLGNVLNAGSFQHALAHGV